MKAGVLTITLISALALPAGASAGQAGASVRGVVLSAQGHNVRLVGAGHVVRGYKVAGSLPKRLRRGDKVTLRARGSRASALRRTGHQRTVQFAGTVIARRSGRATLRLADGSRIGISSTAAGLRAGLVVLVTLTERAHGAAKTAIKLVGGDGSAKAIDSNALVGTVASLEPDGIVLVTDKGRITVAVQDPSQLEGLTVGELVEVRYSVDDDGTKMLNEVSLPDDEAPTDPGFDTNDDGSDAAEDSASEAGEDSGDA